MTLIRPSRDEDVAAITAIYAHHVLHGTGTFETEPPTAGDMASRRADVLSKNLPYLVAEREGELLGFAYPSSFTRWFVSQFGESPNRWRSKQRAATKR